MNTDGFFVEVLHRPRKVAFLVDVDQSSDALFDEIADFNVCSWGGRCNPIIPVVNGQIADSHWRLLRLVDPDVLYAYCNVATDLSKKILSDVRPLTVLKHGQSLPQRPDEFRVGIEHQATILPLLTQLPGRFPVYARKPEPAVLGFDYKDVRGLTSFTRRNFGGNTKLHILCRDHSIPTVNVQPDDKEVMKALASNRNLVVPMHICGEGPRVLRASTDYQGIALTLCFGESPWNFIEYWNRVHFLDGTLGMARSLTEMWMPPSLLEDGSFYEAFLELLRRRVFLSDHQSYLRLVSCDESAERMRDVTNRICTDFRWNMHRAEPVVVSKGELPDFETHGVSGMFRAKSSHSQYEFVAGSGSPLQFNSPSDPPRQEDEQWIAEFMIESPRQERYLVNRKHWWKLPRKRGISELFVADSWCRVGNNYRISAEVSGGQQGVILNIPTEASLFARLILPVRDPDWVGKVDTSAVGDAEKGLYLRMSDKWKYALGVLGLFESFKKAAYVFEDCFWRDVIESLSSPRASDHTKNKVRDDLTRIGVPSLQSEGAIDMIVGEVLDAAGRIQRPSGCTNFGGLSHRYLLYLGNMSPDERLHEVSCAHSQPLSPSDEKGIRDAALSNLRNMLSDLITRKVFLLGAEVQCNRCLASLWYHVDDLKSLVTCRGCRKDVDLPAEIPWSYSLNELVASAVRDHGVLPVIRTIYRLFERSRECFSFLPGLEIRDYSGGPDGQVCELDLAWIRDGEFGIAEVKRTPKKFSVGKSRERVLAAARPDRYLLVSSSGTNEEMQEICSKVQSKLCPEIRVEAWNPGVFSGSAHSGWNTFAVSLFP
jgi:hypothetical protein